MDITEVFKVFNRFYSKYYSSEVDLNKISSKILDAYALFENEIGSLHISEQFLIDYFTLQFDFYKRSNKGLAKPFPHIFLSKKAIDRWRTKKEKSLQVAKTRIHISSTSTKTYFAEKPLFVEETVRKVAKNTLHGLAICIQHTSLYHPQSISCQSCPFSQKCKDTLKSKFYSLFLYRTSYEQQVS